MGAGACWSDKILGCIHRCKDSLLPFLIQCLIPFQGDPHKDIWYFIREFNPGATSRITGSQYILVRAAASVPSVVWLCWAPQSAQDGCATLAASASPSGLAAGRRRQELGALWGLAQATGPGTELWLLPGPDSPQPRWELGDAELPTDTQGVPWCTWTLLRGTGASSGARGALSPHLYVQGSTQGRDVTVPGAGKPSAHSPWKLPFLCQALLWGSSCKFCPLLRAEQCHSDQHQWCPWQGCWCCHCRPCSSQSSLGSLLSSPCWAGTTAAAELSVPGLWVCPRRNPAAVCVLCSINFNQDASLICVSSDHGTVHIFAAEDPKRNKQSR